MEFNSPELKNLETQKQLLGVYTQTPPTLDNVKNDLKLLVCIKNKNHQKYFDQANMTLIKDDDGALFLSKMMNLMECLMVENLAVDDPKKYQISNYFSIIRSSFKGLEKISTSTSKEAVCASIIGLITKNYI